MRIAFYVARYPGESIQTPPSLQYLAGYLMSEGLVSEDDILFAGSADEIVRFAPDILGVGSVTQCIQDANEVAKEVKRCLDTCWTILGGYHISALPEELPAAFDLGVIGEGELTFAAIARQRARSPILDPAKLELISGVCYHENSGKIAVTSPRELIEDIESFGPFRKLAYAQDWPYLFSARGCPYKCSYCASHKFWKTYRPYSAEYVVNEIESLYEEFGANSIYFVDDLFISPKQRLQEIFTRLKEKKLLGKIRFKGFVRINLVDESVIQLLSEMGFVEIRFGMETASQRLLDKIKDQAFSVEEAEKVIHLCNKYDLPVCGSFMFGIPGETEEDITETVTFLRKNRDKFYVAGFYLLQPVPGSEMWDELYAAGEVAISFENFDGFYIDMSKDDFNWSDFNYFNNENIEQSRFIEIMKGIKEEFVAQHPSPERSGGLLQKAQVAIELKIKRLLWKYGVDIRRRRRKYAKEVIGPGAQLYVGCGKDSREGYLGCDVRDLQNVSLVCQAWEVSSLVQKVARIYSRHMLEHLTISQVEATLRDWLIALEEGGQLEIIVPNIDYHIEQMKRAKWDEQEWTVQFSDARHAFAGFWGWQRETAPDSDQEFSAISNWDVHKSGFNEQSIKFFLQRAGFSEVDCKVFDRVHLVARARKLMDPRERQISPSLEGVRADHQARYKLAANYVEPGYRVLDVGCGVGYGSALLADCDENIHVVAVDLSGEAITFAKQFYSRGNVEYIVGDIFALDVQTEQFDLVTCFEVIEHCEEDGSLVQRLSTLLKPGGYFICSSPNQETLPFNADMFPFHCRHYTPEEFHEMLLGAGLSIEKTLTQLENNSSSISEGWDGLFNIAVCLKAD